VSSLIFVNSTYTDFLQQRCVARLVITQMLASLILINGA
jgi:hypothetical protein